MGQLTANTLTIVDEEPWQILHVTAEGAVLPIHGTMRAEWNPTTGEMVITTTARVEGPTARGS